MWSTSTSFFVVMRIPCFSDRWPNKQLRNRRQPLSMLKETGRKESPTRHHGSLPPFLSPQPRHFACQDWIYFPAKSTFRIFQPSTGWDVILSVKKKLTPTNKRVLPNRPTLVREVQIYHCDRFADFAMTFASQLPMTLVCDKVLWGVPDLCAPHPTPSQSCNQFIIGSGPHYNTYSVATNRKIHLIGGPRIFTRPAL